jgi:hypothetical protein
MDSFPQELGRGGRETYALYSVGIFTSVRLLHTDGMEFHQKKNLAFGFI